MPDTAVVVAVLRVVFLLVIVLWLTREKSPKSE